VHKGVRVAAGAVTALIASTIIPFGIPSGTAQAGQGPSSLYSGAKRKLTHRKSKDRHQRLGQENVRPSRPDKVSWEDGVWVFRWSRDKRSGVAFRQVGTGIEIDELYRGPGQPPGTAGLMLADSLRIAGIEKPSEIKAENIINRASRNQMARKTRVDQTIIGKAIEKTARDLGGHITKWEARPQLTNPSVFDGSVTISYQ